MKKTAAGGLREWGGERLGVVRWRFQVWKIICLEKIKTKARMIYK